MNLKTMLRRAAGLTAAALLAVSLSACGGSGDATADQPAEAAYQSLEEAIAANVPEGAAEEQQIAARGGSTIVLYAREDNDAPFTVQAYSEGEDGWSLLASRTPQIGKQDAVQELFPANDSLIALCVSPGVEDTAQQAYEFRIEGSNGWAFGYNQLEALP